MSDLLGFAACIFVFFWGFNQCEQEHRHRMESKGCKTEETE